MNTEAICLCAAGSLCVQLLTLIDIVGLRTDQRPDSKNFAFYLSFVVFPLISGITGYAYFEDTVNINKMLAL